MLDKQRIADVITASLFKPVSIQTQQEIADALGLPADRVVLGSRIIGITDDEGEIHRLQITPEGAVQFLEPEESVE